ncbi:MAG: hypothetical protein ACREQD_16115, partial [Candidatus Binataceae bacterium]
AFLREVIASAPFAAAALSTRFIAEHFPAWRPRHDQLEAALIAAALVQEGASGFPAGAAQDGANAARIDAARSPWTQLGQFEPWSRR